MPDPNEAAVSAAIMREQSAAMREAALILAKANAQAADVDGDVLVRILSEAVTDALGALQSVRT